MFEIKGKYTTAKVMIDDVEQSCVAQITNMVNHPAFINPISIMIDCHSGKGSVIGFTMEMTDKIVPNVVGVDGSCGVIAFNLGKEISMSLEELNHKIRQRIPFGMNVHEDAVIHMKNDFMWHETNTLAYNFAMAYEKKFGIKITPPTYNMDWFTNKCKDIGIDLRKAINSIGTLGSGNHYQELGKDSNDNYWFSIHSGSRNFGLRICNYWQNMGSKIVRKEKQAILQQQIIEIRSKYTGMDIKYKIREAREIIGLDVNVSDELMYLEGENAHNYLFDMIFVNSYAKTNRNCMMKIVLDILKTNPLEIIESVHNFIDFRDLIIRKGAIRSYIGEKMVIPLNMRDGVLICTGKSNQDWNFSANHGSGRLMSRSQAKKNVNLENFKQQMSGIYSTSVGQGTLDEAPDAYKDSKIIEVAIEPTATIIDRIIPIMNMKDSDEKEKD